MKKKLLKIGKTVGSVICIVVGLSIAGFGVNNFLPKKQYAKKEIEEDV